MGAIPDWETAMEILNELDEIVRLFVEELDDPCRRNQQEYGPVWISQALENRARKAIA